MKHFALNPLFQNKMKKRPRKSHYNYLTYTPALTDWDYNSYQAIQIQAYLSCHDFAPNNYTLPDFGISNIVRVFQIILPRKVAAKPLDHAITKNFQITTSWWGYEYRKGRLSIK